MYNPEDVAKRIKAIARERNVQVKYMLQELDFNKDTLTSLSGGSMIKADRLAKIADYLDCSVDYLLGKTDNPGTGYPIIQCKECGLLYDLQDPKQIAEHNNRHQLWKNAIRKFGFCWPYDERERKKAEARTILAQENLSTDAYIEAQMTIFSALFSRSLEDSQYSLEHVSFTDYIAMLLNQDYWKNELPNNVYNEFVNRYGVKIGIPSGTIYSVSKKEKLLSKDELIDFESFDYAMQNETKELSDSDKQILLSLAKQLREAKEKRDKKE